MTCRTLPSRSARWLWLYRRTCLARKRLPSGAGSYWDVLSALNRRIENSRQRTGCQRAPGHRHWDGEKIAVGVGVVQLAAVATPRQLGAEVVAIAIGFDPASERI